MAESITTVDESGQLIVPKEILRHLGLESGNRVLFVIAEDGEVRLKPLAFPTLDSLQGSAGSLPHPYSWEEMREIAREDWVAEWAKRHRE